MAVLIDLVNVGCGRRKNVRDLGCLLVILTRRQVRNNRGLGRGVKGASPNLTKHKAEVQRIATRGRKADWVDDL